MKNLQKGFSTMVLVIIVVVLIIGGGIFYLSSKGNFCIVKINGECRFGNFGKSSGDRILFQVPIRPGDTQEDIIARIEAQSSKFSNEFITAKLFGSNQDLNISGNVLSKDWATDFESKDHSAGFVEIYDANGKLLVRKGLLESGGPAVDGHFVIPFKYYNTLTNFSKPSTKQGKIILYDTDRNTKTSLEIPINFW